MILELYDRYGINRVESVATTLDVAPRIVILRGSPKRMFAYDRPIWRGGQNADAAYRECDLYEVDRKERGALDQAALEKLPRRKSVGMPRGKSK